jgi:uncharacterized protein YjcR
MGGSLVTAKIDNQECLRLYHEGKTDREIADKLRVSPNLISGWRRCRHLHVNPSKQTLDVQHHMIMYERLYRDGYDDYSIARAVGVGNNAVRKWRQKHGLPEVRV